MNFLFPVAPGALLACAGLALAGGAQAQSPAEIESLRQSIAELRADYEARIAALEQRLAAAERSAALAGAGSAAPAAPAAAPRSAGDAAFNPAIGVIFQGTAWKDDNDPGEYQIQGFPLGGEAGAISRGLSIGETEIDISANVDDKFTAWLTTPIVIEEGEAAIEIEEAWLETTALPAGFSLRFGRFFSGIGYQNDRHAHVWDFADQPLAYETFLGSQYLDDGVQLRWVAPTALYLELGGEIMRGGNYPAAGAGHSGFGAYTLFASVGGDVGYSNSWSAGLSFLDATADARRSGAEDEPLLFDGDSLLASAYLVWKWAPEGNWRARNLTFQTEYLWRREDGHYTLAGGPPLAWDSDQQGWYLQATYQPIPRWRVGGRVDSLTADDPGAAFDGTPLAAPDSDPLRYSLMADWSNSEFSRLRFQYTRSAGGLEGGDQFGLQYIYSIGAHGAHTF
jgi:hypothetical protein